MPINPTTSPTTTTRTRLDRVLLVARRPRLQAALEACGQPRRPARVIHQTSLADARAYLAGHRVDLALVEADLPDGLGLDLIRELTERAATTATVLVADRADFALAQLAIRAGADDIIAPPAEPAELRRCVCDALTRRRGRDPHGDRVERLHRLCRKLNDARLDVSRQVDALCGDLVNAYHELASQMHRAPDTDGYADLIRGELDLEELLRVTLEHLMNTLGPCNAAIYLPATMDEYSLGGYVNFDGAAEAADLLLSSLADTFAPRVAEADELVHLTGAADLERWVGRDADDLDGRHVLAVPCPGDSECLAVVLLFRDGDTPFDPAAQDLLAALAPTLGAALERIISVHHRASVHDQDSPFDASDLDLGYDDEELPF